MYARMNNWFSYTIDSNIFKNKTRGTFSKRSHLVTGRRPFGRDENYLDYDYDSEAEWEEGEDPEGILE
jgi:hypothetical protein